MPCDNASANTLTMGITMRTPTTARTTAVNPQRTQDGSCCARRCLPTAGDLAEAATALVCIAPGPAFEKVDQNEHGKRNYEQHDCDGRRLAVGEFLQSRDDEDGSNLSLVRHVSRDEDDRAVLANRTREREGEPR